MFSGGSKGNIGKLRVKIIAIPNIVFQSFITTVPKHITNELEKKYRRLFCGKTLILIKHETLCNDYKTWRLKNVGIPKKIIVL